MCIHEIIVEILHEIVRLQDEEIKALRAKEANLKKIIEISKKKED